MSPDRSGSGRRRARRRPSKAVALVVGASLVVALAVALVVIGPLPGGGSATALWERGAPAHEEAERAPTARQEEGDGGPPAMPPRSGRDGAGAEPPPSIRWRSSRAVGTHSDGRLEAGVNLPAQGPTWRTWDPIEKTIPNRRWRRWGTDRLVFTTLRVLRDYARAGPGGGRVLVGDLSRPRGGDFGPRFGSLGHLSHQNGLDVDVYYPRRDGRPVPPRAPHQVDVRGAQLLVDLFVEAGAEKVFVGPNLALEGPDDVVAPLVHHDNHLHARLPLDPSAAERPPPSG